MEKENLIFKVKMEKIKIIKSLKILKRITGIKNLRGRFFINIVIEFLKLK